jgi:multidrug efflux pump subunit AcrA (membrane-fusion protein)
MCSKQKMVFAIAGMSSFLVMAALVVGCGHKTPNHSRGGTAHEGDSESLDTEQSGAIAVSTIRPKLDPSFVISVEQPAYVEGYYQAKLQSRMAGSVKTIDKDIGDPVMKGEVLLEIDVPDLLQDVAHKEAVVEQRKRETELAEANVKMATAAVEVAKHSLTEKETDVQVAEATRGFRQKELKRFQRLVEGNSPAVTPDIMDERQMFFQSAEAAKASSQAAVLKARADVEETKAKLDAAKADVNLKKALIQVAGKDRDHSQALADYAKITAPFNGVITKRMVDPGSFVQNAATGQTDALLTIERTDIVTVYMKLPNNYAPYVDRGTEAVIEMGELPGQLIHGKVTRFSPSLRETDRTMRVEVDLYNGSREEFQRFQANKEGRDLKGKRLPLFPKVTGTPDRELPHPLLPGMFGKMRLVLHKFKDAYLVPSNVIVSQGGKPYIFVVKNGLAAQLPVEVQVDDGTLAKVSVITKVGNEEIRQELTKDEEIIASNQSEVTEGQPVTAILKDW